jgi:hypothetical protein
MPKNKPLETSSSTHIEEMLVAGDEAGMVFEVVRKYARVLDMTDSGRDIKPLATGMFEAMDRVRALEAQQSETQTPVASILARARAESA